MKQPLTDPGDDVNSRSSQNAADLMIGGFSGLFLLILMLVTVIDVIGRYLLNAPLRGSYEMSAILMAAIVYSGLPIVSQRESHVSVDLLDALFPPRALVVQRCVINVFSAAFFGLIAWRLWILADDALRFRDVTEYLRISRAPISYFGACLAGLAAAIHAFKAMQATMRLWPGKVGER